MNKLRISLFIFVVLSVFGQMSDFECKREIIGINEQWHKIILPQDIFGSLSQSMHDIRIYGISESDTVEAPYILRSNKEKIKNTYCSFKIVNIAYNDDGYYLSFEMDKDISINKIWLEFLQANFDWKVQLEGSQDQLQWFTILEDYRILSIKNRLTDYQFATLSFPESKYRYYRLRFASSEKPILTRSQISHYKKIAGNYQVYANEFDLTFDKETKQSQLILDFEQANSISWIKVDIDETFDFYRPITIKYLSDSISIDGDWQYSYKTIYTGTISSFEDNIFQFSDIICKRLKIVIMNGDNQPLTVAAVEAKGCVFEVIARFTEPADYYLVFGNTRSPKPQYDIIRFKENIPQSPVSVSLGEELKAPDSKTRQAIFQNKLYLWLIMIVIILILAGFSVNMIRKKKKTDL